MRKKLTIEEYQALLKTLVDDGKLVIECADHFAAVEAFAGQLDRKASLYEAIAYAAGSGTYFGKPAKLVLYRDFAPASFGYALRSRDDDRHFMSGGIIYHGPHDGWGNGSSPSFSVSNASARDAGWSVHS